MSDETTLLPCPFCGGEAFVNDDPTGNDGKPHMSGNVGLGRLWSVECDECGADAGFWQEREIAIAAWNTRATHGTLTAEQVRELIAPHLHARPTFDFGRHGAVWEADFQAIADELNAELGSGGAKNLMLRAFGLAQMMYDCWLEACKAGDNVDVSACNAYSYEFDQIAQAMFDMGIDPNGSDYYRSAELGNGTCELYYGEDDDGYDGWYCDSCGGWFQAVRRDGRLVEPKHCQECGKAVKR